LTGCSILRKSKNGDQTDLNTPYTGNILEIVNKQNITNKSFFIQKAEIELVTTNETTKFIGNIRFEYPDKFLISLKTRSGIEGARIYINKDSILVNDRLNKKMYFAKADYFRLKFGLDQSILPLIFGDVILEKKCEEALNSCVDEKANVGCYIKGIYLKYIIDCNKGKVLMVSNMNNYNQTDIKINYSKYMKLGDILLPGIIEFKDSQHNISVKIKILKVDYPWDGNVKFIPGKGYELIELI
jgi:hypothetical protein